MMFNLMKKRFNTRSNLMWIQQEDIEIKSDQLETISFPDSKDVKHNNQTAL